MIAQAFLAFQAPTAMSHAFSASSTSDPTGYTLSSFSNFTQYGQFYVNETFSANSSSTTSLSSLTLGFPSNYTGHILQPMSSASFGTAPRISTSTGTNGTMLVTLSFPSTLAAHTPGKVSLSFWVTGTYSVVPNSDTGTDTNYTVPATFYPSLSTPVDQVSSVLWFPYPNTYVGSTASNYGYADFTNGTAVPEYETWTKTVTDANYTLVSWAKIIMISPDADAGMINFPAVTREISVGTSGALMVTDTITLENLGQDAISSIAVNLLTNATSVTNIPSSIPPLSNVGPATITNGEVSLSGINQEVGPSSAQTIVLQYPLSSAYWSVSNGNYLLNIPGTLPVDGLVNTYSLVFNLPSGFVSTTTGPTTIRLLNVVSGPPATFAFRAGIGSSFDFALPIASIAFIGFFVVALAFKPRKSKPEEKESAIDDMVKSVEDKVSGTNEIVSELRAKSSAVNRLDLSNARTRIDELRSKSASRLANLKTELVDAGPGSQAALNEVGLNDREFDRAIKDLLNSYEQFISRKMKADTFAKVQQSHEHRIQRITNSLLDELQDLRHDYEEEQ